MLGCGSPIILAYINLDITIPRVITCATNMLPYLLGLDCFRAFPQFDGLLQKVHFYILATIKELTFYFLYQLSKSVLSFTTPTTVLRRFLLQSPVRTFIILTVVKSPGFGSNFRHYCRYFNVWFNYAMCSHLMLTW